MSRANRSGFALTEVLVAMTLLLLTSVATAGLLLQSGDALHRAAIAERDMAAAAEAMTRVSLWTRDRLAAEAGPMRVGESTVHITVRSRQLFEIMVAGVDGRPILRTTLFRSDNAL